MDIKYRQKGRKWIAEIFNGEELIHDMGGLTSSPNTFPEEEYLGFNQWCIETLGYNARTAYHIFEFKKRSHLDWFILRWQ